MSAEATRMQDLASEFSKHFPGVIPPDGPDLHSGRGDSLPHSPQPGLLVPLNFSAVVAPLAQPLWPPQTLITGYR